MKANGRTQSWKCVRERSHSCGIKLKTKLKFYKGGKPLCSEKEKPTGEQVVFGISKKVKETQTHKKVEKHGETE